MFCCIVPVIIIIMIIIMSIVSGGFVMDSCIKMLIMRAECVNNSVTLTMLLCENCVIWYVQGGPIKRILWQFWTFKLTFPHVYGAAVAENVKNGVCQQFSSICSCERMLNIHWHFNKLTIKSRVHILLGHPLCIMVTVCCFGVKVSIPNSQWFHPVFLNTSALQTIFPALHPVDVNLCN